MNAETKQKKRPVQVQESAVSWRPSPELRARMEAYAKADSRSMASLTKIAVIAFLDSKGV
jgi:hypothetical protein